MSGILNTYLMPFINMIEDMKARQEVDKLRIEAEYLNSVNYPRKKKREFVNN